jgi:hypothetical protein
MQVAFSPLSNHRHPFLDQLEHKIGVGKRVKCTETLWPITCDC